VLAAVLALVALAAVAFVFYRMSRMRCELAKVQKELAAVSQGNVRANVFAEKAVVAAGRAEALATEARDLADGAAVAPAPARSEVVQR
jgi:hypothetical protein